MPEFFGYRVTEPEKQNVHIGAKTGVKRLTASRALVTGVDRRTENGRQSIVIGKTEKVEITSVFRFFNAEIDWVPAIGKKKAGGVSDNTCLFHKGIVGHGFSRILSAD